MKEIRQIVSILFSDIVGYSSIENDRLYTKVNEFVTKKLDNLIDELNYIYYNTWGDALD